MADMKKWYVQLPGGKVIYLKSNSPHEDLASLGYSKYALTQIAPLCMKAPKNVKWLQVTLLAQVGA